MRADSSERSAPASSTAQPRAGFTLIEVMIMLTVGMVLVGIGLRLSTEMSDAFRSSVANAEMDTSLQRINDRLWEELKDTGAAEGDGTVAPDGRTVLCDGGTTILVFEDEVEDYLGGGAVLGACEEDPEPPRTIEEHFISHLEGVTTSATQVTFRPRIGLDTWNSEITYALSPEPGEIPANGVDDDADGVVDEQRLVRSQDGVTETVAENVVSFNCVRNAGEYKLTIDVSIARQGRGPGETVTRNRTTVVRLRNQPD